MDKKKFVFTSSAILIAFGVVIGASLLTDGIGAYHAAYGIAYCIWVLWPDMKLNAALAGNVVTQI